MKKCAQCGRDIPNGNDICSNCGYSTKADYTFNNVSNNKSNKLLVIVICVIVGFVFFISFGVFGIIFAVFNTDDVKECASLCDGGFELINDVCTCPDGKEYIIE